MAAIRTRTVVGLAATALLLSPGLAGCGQAVEKAAEIAAEQGLEGVGDVDINEDVVTLTDDEGNEAAIGENVPIPDSWPSAVPLYDGGQVAMVSVNAEEGAMIMWRIELSATDAADAYAALLEDAGFTEDSTTNAGGMIISQYTGNGYTISLQAMDLEGVTGLSVQAVPDA